MTRRRRSIHARRLGCEPLESRLVLSGGLGIDPVLHLADSARFDGVDDKIEFADRPELNTSQYTIALWFRADDLVGTQALVARGEDWTKDKAQWVVELNDPSNPGKAQLWYEEANDADHYFASRTTIQPNRWYHFAATRATDGRVKIYLDGQLESERVDARGPALVATPVLVGARLNQPGLVQDYFDGTVHEVNVFNQVLPDSSISQLMADTRPALWLSDRVEVSPAGAYADVAMAANGGFVTVWSEVVAGNEEIFAQRIDGAGQTLGQRISVNTTTAGRQHDPSVAMRPDGSFVVAWASDRTGGETVYARLFGPQGNALGGELTISTAALPGWGEPAVAADGQGNMVVAYYGNGVLAQRVSKSGGLTGAPIVVTAQTPSTYTEPSVAMNRAGFFVVSYPVSQYDGTALAGFAPDGRRLADWQVSESVWNTGMALNDAGLVAVSYSAYYPQQPVGDPYALFVQLCTLEGQMVGSPMFVTSGKAGHLDWLIYDSDIALGDRSLAVTWMDYDYDGTGSFSNGVYAARFDLAGKPLGAEVAVATTPDSEMLPAIAMGSEGNCAIAWQRQWGDGVSARLVSWTTPATALPPPALAIDERLEFNGVNQFTALDRPELNVTQYTIAFSFRADNPTRGTQALIARGEDWAVDKAQWVIEINDPQNPGKLQLWYEDANDGDHYFAAPAAIEAGRWYHAVFTRSLDGMVRVYLDGQKVYERLDAVRPAKVNTPVTLGARRNQPGLVQDYFDGAIQGVRIYDFAVAPDQVPELLPPPIPQGDFENGTIAPWVLTGAGAVVRADFFQPSIQPAGGQYMGFISTLNNEFTPDRLRVDLDGNGEIETEVSAMSLTFTTQGTSLVSFDLNLLTDELMPSGAVNDSDLFGVTTGTILGGPHELFWAVAAANGSYSGTAQPLTIADFVMGDIQHTWGGIPTLPDSSRFQGQTGFHTYSVLVGPGTHTLTFFVIDSHTDGVASAMLIDNLTVVPQPPAESSALAVAAAVDEVVKNWGHASTVNLSRRLRGYADVPKALPDADPGQDPLHAPPQVPPSVSGLFPELTG